MKPLLSKLRNSWAAYNELAMAPIAFIVFAIIYYLVAWLWSEIPLPGPSRLLGPMFGAFLVFVGWTAGTLSYYWNSKERFEFLFKTTYDWQFHIGANNRIESKELVQVEKPLDELFRCHVLYLWHCSIFVFGLVLSQ
jgi:hypothetical protein